MFLFASRNPNSTPRFSPVRTSAIGIAVLCILACAPLSQMSLAVPASGTATRQNESAFVSLAGAVAQSDQRNWPAGDRILLAAGAWLFIALIYCSLGFRQRNEAGGTLLRLVWVAALASAIALLPLATSLLVRPDVWQSHADKLISTIAVLSCLWVGLFMRPPLSRLGRSLPLVDDAGVVAGVERIASVMGIAAPRLRKRELFGATTKIGAWVGGLPRQSIVVTDGMLHRLTADEGTAIIAHEMGHIVNHSIWLLAGVFPIACAFAVVAAKWHDAPDAVLLGMIFFVGLRRVVSRAVEADCDRRAGRAAGFSQMISALEKVYAAHELRNRGFWPTLAFAMATHPSIDVRLSLLTRASWRCDGKTAADTPPSSQSLTNADDESTVRFIYSPRRFWIHRFVSCAALLIWAAGLALLWRAKIVPALIAWILIFTPSFLLLAAQKPETRRMRQRARVTGQRSWARLLKLAGITFLIGVGCGLPLSIAIAEKSEKILAILGITSLAVISIIWAYKSQVLARRRFYRALHEHDFPRALEIGRGNRRLSGDPMARYIMALVEVVQGNAASGIKELEQIAEKNPKFRLARVGLFCSLIDNGHVEKARQVAEAAAVQSPKDPLPYGMIARASRLLSRCDEARAAATKSLELDGDDAFAEAMMAGVELDAGHVDEAQRRVARALILSPAHVSALIMRAEILLANGDRVAAERAIEAATSAARASPFSFVNRDLARLNERLASCDCTERIIFRR